MIKAVLLDFDGTLVNKDILDIVCGITGKEKESRNLNQEFHLGKRPGIETLMARINFLKGITPSQIKAKLDKNPSLTKGAKQLVNFLNKKGIISILHSGNIVPILKYYQQLLKITFIVGTTPKIQSNVILGISKKDIPSKNFKLDGIKRILGKLDITPGQVLAIGDSPADIPIFQFAGYSLAVNPKEKITSSDILSSHHKIIREKIEKHANCLVDDLNEVILIIKRINKES